MPLGWPESVASAIDGLGFGCCRLRFHTKGAISNRIISTEQHRGNWTETDKMVIEKGIQRGKKKGR